MKIKGGAKELRALFSGRRQWNRWVRQWRAAELVSVWPPASTVVPHPTVVIFPRINQISSVTKGGKKKVVEEQC